MGLSDHRRCPCAALTAAWAREPHVPADGGGDGGAALRLEPFSHGCEMSCGAGGGKGVMVAAPLSSRRRRNATAGGRRRGGDEALVRLSLFNGAVNIQ